MLKKFGFIFALMVLLPVHASAKDIDCNNMITQRDMNHCAALEYKQADADLNHDYKYAKAALERVDSNIYKSERGAAKALLNAQRAWIKFRDQACLAEGYPHYGGSIRPLIELTCKTKLTRQRIEQLRFLIDTN